MKMKKKINKIKTPFIISIKPRIPEIYPIVQSTAPRPIWVQTFQWLFGKPQVYIYIIGGIKKAGKTTQKQPIKEIYPTIFWYTLDSKVVKNKVIPVKIILNFLLIVLWSLSWYETKLILHILWFTCILLTAIGIKAILAIVIMISFFHPFLLSLSLSKTISTTLSGVLKYPHKDIIKYINISIAIDILYNLALLFGVGFSRCSKAGNKPLCPVKQKKKSAKLCKNWICLVKPLSTW